MQIRVRKGLSIASVQVDAIICCNNHSIAQKYNTETEKFQYFQRNSGNLFWSERPCKKQDANFTKVIRRMI